MNSTKTTLYLGVLTGLFLLIGHLLGGQTGMTSALFIAGIINIIGLFFSDKIVLMMHGAKPIENDPKLRSLIQSLSQSAGIPTPKLYLYTDHNPNAFATGRDYNHAAVAVSSGILDLLNENELKGVIAHELAHIKNHDTLIATIAATFAGAISHLINFAYYFGGSRQNDEDSSPNPIMAIVIMIATPIIAMLIQMAISRGREFLADAIGAKIAGSPEGLKQALLKLHSTSTNNSDFNPHLNATAHLYIVNNFNGQSFIKWFSTHPPVEDRITALNQLRI